MKRLLIVAVAALIMSICFVSVSIAQTTNRLSIPATMYCDGIDDVINLGTSLNSTFTSRFAVSFTVEVDDYPENESQVILSNLEPSNGISIAVERGVGDVGIVTRLGIGAATVIVSETIATTTFEIDVTWKVHVTGSNIVSELLFDGAGVAMTSTTGTITVSSDDLLLCYPTPFESSREPFEGLLLDTEITAQ